MSSKEPCTAKNIVVASDEHTKSVHRGSLTLKELMDSPAIARTHHFQGLASASLKARGVGVADGTDAPCAKRRKSEECPSLEEFFASSAGSMERRRNQTFSVGNTISLEKFITSADPIKRPQKPVAVVDTCGKDKLSDNTVTVDEKDNKDSVTQVVVSGEIPKSEAIAAVVQVPERSSSPPMSDYSSSSDGDSNPAYFGRKRKLVIDETIHDDASTRLLSSSQAPRAKTPQGTELPDASTSRSVIDDEPKQTVAQPI